MRFPRMYLPTISQKTSASYWESLVTPHNDLVSPDTPKSHMGRLCQTAGYQLRPQIAYTCAL